MIRYRLFDTPAGPFALIQRDDELAATWVDDALPADARIDPAMLPGLSKAVSAYFRGRPASFDDVPTPRGTAFHVRCWEACRSIPPGQTRTYGELAAMAGRPGAARAAGGAMRSNPLPVIVPCHRIVGARDLHGYGGSTDPDSRPLAIKRMLLELEGAACAAAERPR